jgi:hypothetical protein
MRNFHPNSSSMRFFILLLFMPVAGMAQPGLESLVQAEKTFAKLAWDRDTRTAFLANLHPNAMVTTDDGFTNGSAFWKARPESDAKLWWSPRFACISPDETLGFTTGPYAFYGSKTSSEPVSRGQFTTVWTRDSTHTWKVWLDIGTLCNTVCADSSVHKGLVAAIGSPGSIVSSAAEAEVAWVKAWQAGKKRELEKSAYERTWWNVQDNCPSISATVPAAVVSAGKSNLRTWGEVVDKDQSLYAVYGTVEGPKRTRHWLRVWLLTSTGWKLQLMVLD